MATAPTDRAALDRTWIALTAGTLVLVALPTDVHGMPTWARIVLTPASRIVEVAGLGNEWLPMVTAAGLVAIALTVDVLVAWRVGKRGSGLRGPLASWRWLALGSFLAAFVVSVELRFEEALLTSGWSADEVERRRIELPLLVESLAEEVTQAPETTRRVVWIGDSLTMAVFQAADPLPDRPGDDLAVLPLAAAGVDLPEWTPHLGPLLEQDIDLLVIEANVLHLKHVPSIEGLRSDRPARWAAKRRRLGDWVEPRHRESGAAIPGVTPDDDGWTAARRWRRREVTDRDPSRRLASELVRSVRAKGARCVLVQLPVAERLRDAVPVFFAERQASLDAWARSNRVDWIQLGPTAPNECFVDDVHATRDAATRHVERLTEALLDALED